MVHRVLTGLWDERAARGTVPRPSCTPSCSSVRPSACSAASPHSPVPTSPSTWRDRVAPWPNGAGKTTLLRGVRGLVPVTQGQAVGLGDDLSSDPRSVRVVSVSSARHVALRRPHRGGEREVLEPHGGCFVGGDRRRSDASRSGWPSRGPHGRSSFGGSTPPHCSRRTGRPPAGAMASRRTSRRVSTPRPATSSTR